MKKINFNLTKTPELVPYQTVIFEEIKAVLGSAVPNQAKPGMREGCLNIAMFLPRNAEILLPYKVSDRNYLFRKSGGEFRVQSFEALLVPGRWLQRRITSKKGLDFDPRRVIPVGSPRIDMLRRLQAKRPKPAIIDQPEGGLEENFEPLPLNVFWLASPLNEQTEQDHLTSTQNVIPEYAEALSEVCDFHYFPDVDEGDFDRNRLDQALLDADVIITDCDSILFDAWALGKPVIFPHWLVGEAIIARYGAAVEAHLYNCKIGLHASSFGEMVEMIQQRPEINQRVIEFMMDYLENYLGDTSAEMIVQALQRLADSDALATGNKIKDIADFAVAKLPTKDPIAGLPAKSRASIQLVQQAVISGSSVLADDAMRLMRSAKVSATINAEFLGLEIEQLLMRSKTMRAQDMIDEIQDEAPLVAQFHRARFAYLRGELMEALEECSIYFAKGGRSAAAYKTLTSILRGFGLHTLARSILLRLNKAQPSLELLMTAADTIENSGDLGEYLWSNREHLARFREAFGAGGVDAARLHAFIQAGEIETAAVMAQEQAQKVLTGRWRWPEKNQLAGWRTDGPMPLWHSPFENLPRESARNYPMHTKATFIALVDFINANDIPVFVSGLTLRDWVEFTQGGEFPETLEFGVRAADGADEIMRIIASSGMFELIEPIGRANAEIYHFKNTNGVRVALRVYYAKSRTTVLVKSSGVHSTLTDFDLVKQTYDEHTVLVPRNLKKYLAQAFSVESNIWGGLSIFAGNNSKVVDENRLIIATCLEIMDGVEWDQPKRVASGTALMTQLGKPEVWFAASGMHGKYLAEDLHGLMKKARYLLHIGDGVDASFYVDLWYSYCKNADPNAILVVRTLALYNYLKKNRPELDVVFIKTALEIEWLIANTPNLLSVMYISNVGNNLHVLRFNHLIHIFLGHGDSDKVASCHKFFRVYDEVWCAGQAQIDRFRNSGFDYSSIDFRIVGRPTLRNLMPQLEQTKPGSFLYLPTWEGNLSEQAYSSVEACADFLPAAVELTETDAVAKFHPWVGRRLPHLSEIETHLKRTQLKGKKKIRVIERSKLAADLMTDAAFLIADISSVVSDFLPTGRPIFLYMPAGKNLRMASSSMPMESYCYLFNTPDELLALIRRVIVDGDDFLGETRLKARQYFVDIDRSLNGQFEQSMHDLVAEKTRPFHPWHRETPTTLVTEPRSKPLVVGHRGAKNLYCENSLEGYQAMAEMDGLGAVEIDIHLTADNRFVVHHDAFLERTTTGTGFVRTQTLAELRKLQLKWTPPDAQEVVVLNEPVPTLDEVLDILQPTGLHVFIEMKNDAIGNHYDGMDAMVLDNLRARDMLERVTLTSFSPEVLERIRELDKAVPLLASVNFRSIETLGGLDETIARFASIPGCGLTLNEALLRALNSQNGIGGIDPTRVGIWVVNKEEAIQAAIQAGHREIFTDRPDIAIEQLNLKPASRRQ